MKSHQLMKKKGVCGIVLAALFGLSACSGEKAGPPDSSQVAARVNAEEISIHQINSMLTARPSDDDAASKSAARAVLDRLVDRELLVQQAEKHRIDRTPQVVQALESAKKDIIARAYLENMTAQLARPDTAQVKQFYQSNPALFYERKIYTLRELGLAFPAGADAGQYMSELQSLLASHGNAGSLEPLSHWAQQRDVTISENNGVKAAEELPMDVLPKFAAMKQGDIGYLRNGNGIVVFQILAILDAPIAEKNAQPMIENILMTTKQTDLVASEMKRLRGGAHIEYMGEFADTVAAVEAAEGSPEAGRKTTATAQ
jgi:EpsD family peptidyl-prolyl cis-trans isomerase